MENVYGIEVTNRYQLFLNEDEDSLEVLEEQERDKKLKKKSKSFEKENKGKQYESKGKPSVSLRQLGKETQNTRLQDQKHNVSKENVHFNGPVKTVFVRKLNTKLGDETNNQMKHQEKPIGPSGDIQRDVRGKRRIDESLGPNGDGLNQEGKFRGSTNSVIGRGMSRVKSSREALGSYDGREKRKYDRPSRTDKIEVRESNKNYGTKSICSVCNREWVNSLETTDWHTDESGNRKENPEVEGLTNECSDETKTVPEEQKGGDRGVEAAEPADVPEEHKELTLDEWRALKGTRSKPQYNLRKAGEGEDLSRWKEMYALQRKQEEENEDDECCYDSSEYPQRVGRQKHVLDIQFTFFADSRNRGRGGRGATRGGSRGSAADHALPQSAAFLQEFSDTERKTEPRWFHRQSRQSSLKVDDEHDFPSLG